MTHCIVAFAHALNPAGLATLRTLDLPHLQQLLHWSTKPAQRLGIDSHNMPHEHALAHILQWPEPQDGYLPLAAWTHATPSGAAWVWPCQWLVGMDQVAMQPFSPAGSVPASATESLDANTAHALWSALAPLAQEDGLTLTLDAPHRWLLQGELLRSVRSTSLDRVAQRPIDSSQLRADTPAERLLMRLQNETQMLFYDHPLYDERQQHGLAPVNGVWFSGAGALGASVPDLECVLDARLRDAAVANDWPRWGAMWQTLDAEVLGPLVSQAQAGRPVQVTLCGELGWQTWHANTPHTTPSAHAPSRAVNWARLARWARWPNRHAPATHWSDALANL